MAECRICSGELDLRVRGHGAAVTSAALSPSAHAVGGHGDLLACRECGTVQHPILPKGEELHDLYREMRDDAYLGEEAGLSRIYAGIHYPSDERAANQMGKSIAALAIQRDQLNGP